jgi:two-component system, chemotaxis family, protein-glutamate methylesterase/glutaminase
MDIFVVGSSSGGIEALRTIVADLPKDFNGSIFIVQHTSPQSPGVLPTILQSSGLLPAVNATDGEQIRPGYIYVAPPDYHMIIEPGRVRLSRGPKENRFRPAVDPLFRSAAQVYGPRVVGIILSGALDDGTSGLWIIKKLGGTTVVQDPDDALLSSMPRNAMTYVKVDYSLPSTDIAALMVRLSTSKVRDYGECKVPERTESEIRISKEDNSLKASVNQFGEPSVYTCPECHGVLMKLEEGGRLRFRCHTGHAYSSEALLASISEAVEDSVWNAVRSIQEKIMLLEHLSEHLRNTGDKRADEFMLKAKEAQARSDLLRTVVFENQSAGVDKVESNKA